MGSVVETHVTDPPAKSSSSGSGVHTETTTSQEGLSSPLVSDNLELCYEPITTFEELMEYGEEDANQCQSNHSVLKDLRRKKTVPLMDTSFSKSKIGLCGKAAGSSDRRPLTLVCHDLKGGYGDDRFVNGSGNMENYVYRNWLMTDIFVYFSHKFVTIPPLGWINAAHSHGVKILGTIITEWDDGVKLCSKILASEESINRTVEKLCAINEDYGFDGYLLNIENVLEGNVSQMIEFASKLTKALKKKSSKNMIIWYDSVTKTGELKWQDALNDKNKIFFDVCDGIFLNYNWNDEKLRSSALMAGDRRYDVFVGVDCWGRGCWAGGGLNTYLAVDRINSHDLSYAVFAPGWTYETQAFQQYPLFDDELWTKCMKNMYFRCLAGSHAAKSDEISEKNQSKTSGSKNGNEHSKDFQVYFATDFSRGYGAKKFSFGKILSDDPWFDLSKQSFQPIIFSSAKCLDYDCNPVQVKFAALYATDKKREDKPSTCLVVAEPKVIYDTENGFSGGGALKLLNSKKRKDFEDPLTSSPIWIPLNIPITASRLTIATIAIWRSVSIHHQLKLYLELGKDGCQNRKILLGSLDSLATSVRGKFFISLQLSQFFGTLPNHLKLSNEALEKNDLTFYFQKNNYDEKELNGWRVSCYLFDIDQVYDEYSSIKSLRVGADGDISLGFLSLGQITHYQS
ncbi:Cytosolic endo-beta-N-acetylglucosaminidase 1 [Orchesella cincta]|uniref:Cytosolic endo-beta-N-acetylglucosaminidase n=1 Tax=Orchesella cincta TaxID=48709 RepID=A0A1D2N3E4_ORCCI|nr:Cytosolic endo-beta-N-acetylglucosaminidase 1 [Orchesella cincta]